MRGPRPRVFRCSPPSLRLLLALDFANPNVPVTHAVAVVLQGDWPALRLFAGGFGQRAMVRWPEDGLMVLHHAPIVDHRYARRRFQLLVLVEARAFKNNVV